MDYTEALAQFDFTKNEATIYVALLELGLTNVGPLVTKTGMHRQLVYECLESLERRGYVTSVQKNNRKNVQASSPNTILKQAEERTEQAKNIIPSLLALQSHSLDAVEVQTLYGAQGFRSNLRDLILSANQTDGIIRILGGAKDQDFYAALGSWYPEYVKLANESHVSKLLIAPTDYAEEFKQKFANEKSNVLRLLKVGLTSPTYTRITQEMVSMEIYIPGREITVIQIRNRAIAKAYIEHFTLLWEQAQEYKLSTIKK